MLVIGIDAHKRTHTAVAVDGNGAELSVKTVAANSAGHLELVHWTRELGSPRCFAVEDCRHLTRQIERDLLGAGESVVRVPPKLMAGTRQSARTRGKSDPIDALAVARAALREPGLPVASSDGEERALRCSSTTEKTWSPSARGSSTGCAGTSTPSIPSSARRPVTSRA